MSEPGIPEPDTLIFGLLLSTDVSLDHVLQRLSAHCGTLRAVAPVHAFSESHYYDREMGEGVRRTYAAAEKKVDPGTLGQLKLQTNALEREWSLAGRRRVNLDPGLLNLTQLVLATGKPAGHRIYVGDGIYSEVEYVFESGTFKCLPWTYPDYRAPEAIAFFNGLRRAHRSDRRGRPEKRP